MSEQRWIKAGLVVICAYLYYIIHTCHNLRQSLIFHSPVMCNGNISDVSYDGCTMKFNTTLVSGGHNVSLRYPVVDWWFSCISETAVKRIVATYKHTGSFNCVVNFDKFEGFNTDYDTVGDAYRLLFLIVTAGSILFLILSVVIVLVDLS